MDRIFIPFVRSFNLDLLWDLIFYSAASTHPFIIKSSFSLNIFLLFFLFVASCCRRGYTQLDSLMGILASKHASEQENFFSVLEACCFFNYLLRFSFFSLGYNYFTYFHQQQNNNHHWLYLSFCKKRIDFINFTIT